MLAATAACCNAAVAMDTVKTTPSTSELTPAQWRAQQLAAADKSDAIMRDAQKEPGLLAQYAHMQMAYDSNRDRAFQLIFGQYLSWYLTYIGDYDGARSAFSIAQPPQDNDGPSPSNGGYQLRPAADVILEMSKDRKAVFFNEAHSAPITRALTIQLLARLREQGFNYFAAETLYLSDKDLNKRGYPTAQSGFYTNEPLYAEMVRTALRLGYTVVAYDAENAGVGDPRERAGAENLAQIFKKDPKARLVVNAGFAHVQKSGKYLGGSSMGEFFHKITGIDPLTIEQTMMIQHARPDQDHPYYLAVTQGQRLAAPSVFVSGNKAWTLKPDEYDMSVFFPPQESTSNERPDWLALGGLRTQYGVAGELCNTHYPCLVEARYASEGADGIPADRVLLNVIAQGTPAENRVVPIHGTVTSRLYLRPAKYRVTAMDMQGRIVTSRDIDFSADTAAKP